MSNETNLDCAHIREGHAIIAIKCTDCYPGARLVKRYIGFTMNEAKGAFREYHENWGVKFKELKKTHSESAALRWMEENFY